MMNSLDVPFLFKYAETLALFKTKLTGTVSLSMEIMEIIIIILK